jgi:hypothetical protein
MAMQAKENNLLFVYNAKKGMIHEALDFAHKIVSPASYSCELCMLTHNYFSKRKEWKEFEERSPVSMQFYHIDDFEKEYGLSFDYPVILSANKNNIELLYSKTQIAAMNEVSDLIQMIENVISHDI